MHTKETFNECAGRGPGAVAEITLGFASIRVEIGTHAHIAGAQAEIHAVQQRTLEERVRRIRPVRLPVGQGGVRGLGHHHVVQRPRVRHPARRGQREITFGHVRAAHRNMCNLGVHKPRHLPGFLRGGHLGIHGVIKRPERGIGMHQLQAE